MLESVNLDSIYFYRQILIIPGIDEVELEIEFNLFVWGEVWVWGCERSGFLVATLESFVTSIDLETSTFSDNCTGVYISKLPMRIEISDNNAFLEPELTQDIISFMIRKIICN